MKFFKVRFPLILLITLCLSWGAAEAENYGYPYHDPYLATATTAILNDDRGPRIESQMVHVPGLPGRNRLPTLEGRGEVNISLYRQDHPAPLLFILSGVGSNPYFGVATYLASLFYREDFNVAILPSPMSWNFALSASRSGAPGYAPADARDLYEVMQKSLSVLRTRYNVKITQIDFVGISLGALEGAYLSVIDDQDRKIGIEKYLLINPPVDLSYGLKKIDEWDALKNRFGLDKSRILVGKALNIVDSFSDERRDDPAVFDRFAKDVSGFTTEEIQFLIAEDVRTLLPELIYVTQVMHNQNVLAGSMTQKQKRLDEAHNLTFKDYIERIALPLWRAADPEANLADFIEGGSLRAILDQLRGNAKVHIMHNADDLFVDKQSIEELKETMNDQMTLYPYGGHLGNLWYPENKEYITRFFSVPNRPIELYGLR